MISKYGTLCIEAVSKDLVSCLSNLRNGVTAFSKVSDSLRFVLKK